MQCPREARTLHRRMRGCITRAIVGPERRLHGIDPAFALSGLNTNTVAPPRALPWAISFGPFRAGCRRRHKSGPKVGMTSTGGKLVNEIANLNGTLAGESLSSNG